MEHIISRLIESIIVRVVATWMTCQGVSVFLSIVLKTIITSSDTTRTWKFWSLIILPLLAVSLWLWVVLPPVEVVTKDYVVDVALASILLGFTCGSAMSLRIAETVWNNSQVRINKLEARVNDLELTKPPK